MSGWECPRCHAIWAPSVQKCCCFPSAVGTNVEHVCMALGLNGVGGWHCVVCGVPMIEDPRGSLYPKVKAP